MNRIGATVATALVATLAALTRPRRRLRPTATSRLGSRRAAKQAEAVPAPQVERVEPVERPWGIRSSAIGQGYTLKNGETARDVTVIFGDANIEGRVDRDVVVVLGSAHLASTAVIDGSLVVVGGSIKAADGREDQRGPLRRRRRARRPCRASRPAATTSRSDPRRSAGCCEDFVPWLTRGLLWGRPIVPGLPGCGPSPACSSCSTCC